MVTRLVVAFSTLVLGMAAAAVQSLAREITVSAAEPSGQVRAASAYGRMPIAFARSKDSIHGAERFVGHAGGQWIAISARGLEVVSTGAGTSRLPATFALDFLGAARDARLTGEDLQAARIHRLNAIDSGRSDIDIPAYGRVRVTDAYPGIDLVFYGYGNTLEYDIVVAPGADPSAFGFRTRNGSLSLDDHGNVRVAERDVTWMIHRPVAYQEMNSERADVDSMFVLTDRGDVHVRVAAYDRSRPLVIDPVVSYAASVGGQAFEQGTAIAVDAAGNAYIAGYTQSADFPTLSPYDRSLGKSGDVDVFVSKLNPAGTALVWSTYIGGAASVDRSVGIAVDATGSVYVTGQTASNNFPVTATAWQKAITGGGAFVTKLAPAGNALVYSTYVAGATANAIAVDASGNAHVAGTANSAFLTTPGALQPVYAASGDTGFVLKLNATGGAPVYSTFLGGTGTGQASAIAVDRSGNAYIGGWTSSPDFPLVNALQGSLRGQKDGFVAKLDSNGSRLLYSTFLGGTLDDAVNALAVDGDGYVFVAGETYSSDFPSKDGFQPNKSGYLLINSSVGNAFIAKLAPGGSGLVYASFLGGEVCTTYCQLVFGPLPQFRADAAYGIAVDSAGHAYVTGIARSYSFPLVDSSSMRKQEDNQDSGFVAKVSSTGSALLWSTFVRTGYNGGSNGWTRFPSGAVTAVAVDGFDAAYVTGDSDSAGGFQPTPGAFQTTNGNIQGAIAIKFAAGPAMTLTSSNTNADAGTPVTLTATLAGAAVSGTVLFLEGPNVVASAPLVANRATLTTTLSIGIHPLSALLRIPGVSADTPVLRHVVDVPLACNL